MCCLLDGIMDAEDDLFTRFPFLRDSCLHGKMHGLIDLIVSWS